MTLEEIDFESLGEAVGITTGFVSMCWDPRPVGVFDSTLATGAVDHLVNWINQNYTKNEENPYA